MTTISLTAATPPGLTPGPLARRALALLAGVLFAASYALHPWWWATWLAPIPLLWAASTTAARARVAGGAAGVVAVLGLAPYYLEIGGPAMVLVILLLRVAALVLALRLTQFAADRLPLGTAMLVLPATLAALEQISLSISVHGAAGSIAYSQMDMPALVQVAALGGVPAVVFLILLPGSLIGLWLARPWPVGQRVGGAGAVVLIGLAVALFSAVRLRAAPGEVQATMISTDRFPGIPQDWHAVWSVYRPAVQAEAKREGLVVLPEKIALLEPGMTAQAERDVGAVASETNATIVVGIEVKGDVYRNRALVAAPDGTVLWYDKQRMVPGFEDRDLPGKTPLFAALGRTPFGVAICKDMHIPSIGREYAGRVGLMAIPAWDFGRDGWMGARMSALRAVENGYAIVRASRNGLVGAYDSNGRVIGERASSDGIVVTQARVPTHPRATLYGRIGNVFGWGCVALCTLLIGWVGAAAVQRRRAP